MRKSLELNYELVLPIAGGARSYWIDYVMGDGATSIVYKAHYYDDGNNFHEVIIKECYPYSARITRQEASLVWEDPQEQTDALEAFQNAHKKLSSIHLQNKLRNSTSAAMEICSANNTLYSIQHLVAGTTYDKDNSKKLEDILETTLALTKVIAEYHNLNMLHLDIKPENFMVLPETKQMAVLFDVDTVTSLKAIASGSIKAVPSSEGWAAPEQLSGKLDQLCPATDLYAIGACLFSKVVGRKVTAEDTGIFAQWDFLESITENANPQATRLVRNILRKTIAASIRRRYQTAQELITALEDAVKVAREDVFVVSNCPPSMAQFIGREDELAKIHDHFNTGCRAVFLYGFGGIGKTELSKKYVECFGQEYDACIFQMYQPEYGLKKYIENIQIHNFDGKDTEKQLRGLLNKSRVLLIVDNFDVDDADYFEEFLSLDADILFTTRNDFSDQTSDTIKVLNLDALPLGQLLVLFQRELGRPMSLEDLQAAQKIIESYENWTMIVSIAAKQIVASGQTVSEYAEMIERDGFFSPNEDTEEIRIRYHGKLHRKTREEILRYVFTLGKLDAAELEALCNVSVLRYHNALTKERYRYYTGAKNLNALNRIINAGWVKYDHSRDTISLHQTVIELIESDIERTPTTIPGIFSYIQQQFALLDGADSTENAKNITFALLMMSDISMDSKEAAGLFAHLSDFAAKVFPLGANKLYRLLCDSPSESTWHMNATYLAPKLTIPKNQELLSSSPFEYVLDFLQKQVVRYSILLIDGEEAERPVEFFPDCLEKVTNFEEATAYEEMASRLIDVFASIIPSPRFSSTAKPQQDSDWRLHLSDYPEEYPYHRFLIKSIQDMLKVAEEYDIQLDEKYCAIANNIIIHIQESLGLFAWHNMSSQQILAYPVLTDDAYQAQQNTLATLHYTKKAKAWYSSLENTLSNCEDPYYIYKLVMDTEYDISKSRAAALVKNNFAAKLLLDSRLTGIQKRTLAIEFGSKQVDNMRFKHCRRPKKIKHLGTHHKNHLVFYAQLLSAAELSLAEIYTTDCMQTRVDILRAAFILKRTIGVELLDPKPYILNDITAVNIEWLSELLELAEWTRTSGYIKQSQQMKNRLIDCCLELDYTSLSESTIQLILYKLWPLAHNYNRQDAVEVMNPLWDFRREFYADLITSTHLDTAEKRKIVRRMADEYLDEICSTYHAKAHNKIADVLEDSEHTNDYKRLRAIFIEHYEHIKELFDQGYNRWVDMCLHVTAQEKGDQYFHPFVFVEHCEKRLSHLISEDQYAFVYNQDEIEGLMYYVFEKADIKVLSSEAEDFILDLSEEAGYQPEHIAKIIENIHRIRPETKEFLAIE